MHTHPPRGAARGCGQRLPRRPGHGHGHGHGHGCGPAPLVASAGPEPRRSRQRARLLWAIAWRLRKSPGSALQHRLRYRGERRRGWRLPSFSSMSVPAEPPRRWHAPPSSFAQPAGVGARPCPLREGAHAAPRAPGGEARPGACGRAPAGSGAEGPEGLAPCAAPPPRGGSAVPAPAAPRARPRSEGAGSEPGPARPSPGSHRPAASLPGEPRDRRAPPAPLLPKLIPVFRRSAQASLFFLKTTWFAARILSNLVKC